MAVVRKSAATDGGAHIAAGERADVIPAPWNARTRLHEYGGRSWIAVPGESGDTVLIFANFADQRLYRWEPGAAEPVALTPEPPRVGSWRYAELTPSRDGREIWCVRESHDADGIVTRALIAVALDGSGAVRVLGTDTHFLSSLRISPDGRRLAWIGWEHPNMPWDTTFLRVAEIDDSGSLGKPVTVLGGTDESVMQPTWVDDETLYAISDRSGWWNLYRVGLDGGEPQPLCPRDEEFGSPAWTTGAHNYVLLDGGRILAVHGVGRQSAGVLDPATGELTDLDLPYTSWGSLATDGVVVTATANQAVRLRKRGPAVRLTYGGPPDTATSRPTG